ncbi:MAG TPA: hypothetical protein VK358_11660 [Longimicrobium sp.]|nr:hypothetical protein [Longimicrobium sp.]
MDRPDLAADHAAFAAKMGIPADAMRDLRLGTIGRCQVIAAQEAGRWHMSISHPFRLPPWDEINAARDEVIPADIWLCQPMPPRAFWMSHHEYCLHLWEVRDRPLLEQWAFDGCRDEQKATAAVDAFLRARGGQEASR